MSRLYLLTLIFAALALLIFLNKEDPYKTIPAGEGLVIPKEWLAINQNPITPKEGTRPADQTFLTFPEWYLVFSPEEQANAFKTKTATTFPFGSHIGQLWDSYEIINDQIKDNFPVNTGYHFMIWVIATSTTVEYGVKAWYEKVVGRLTDTKKVITEEDQFNAAFARSYVDFIKDRPWYEFDFKTQLIQLWSDVPFWGSHFLRKVERRYILTSELLVKHWYGKLIGAGTQTVYEVALPTTVVVLDRVPVKTSPEMILKTLSDSAVVIKLPRYDRFRDAIREVAKQGISIREVAGNTSAVLITVILPANANLEHEHIQRIFTQVISSQPVQKRVAFAVQVKDISKVLVELMENEIEIEHVFDF